MFVFFFLLFFKDYSVSEWRPKQLLSLCTVMLIHAYYLKTRKDKTETTTKEKTNKQTNKQKQKTNKNLAENSGHNPA